MAKLKHLKWFKGFGINLKNIKKHIGFPSSEDNMKLHMNKQDKNNIELLISNVELQDAILNNGIYKTIIDWDKISTYQLPIDLLRKFRHLLNWRLVARFTKLNHSKIIEFFDELDLPHLANEQQLTIRTYDFIINHFKSKKESDYRKTMFWKNASSSQRLSEKYIKKYFEYLHIKDVCMYQKLSQSFIEEYIDKLDLKSIGRNSVLTEDFIEKNISKLSLENITYGTELSFDFIDRHFDEFDIYSLTSSQKLNDEILEKNYSKFDCFDLCYNQKLSIDFIKSHLNDFTLNDLIASCFYTKEESEIISEIYKQYSELL